MNFDLFKDTELVYEDEGYVVFRDFRPASEHHLLVIPRRHVRGIRHLKEEDIPVIRELENIGKKVKKTRILF
jgi:diadenosine tetraphosphate (Ap4A) HIT family hydrolase